MNQKRKIDQITYLFDGRDAKGGDPHALQLLPPQILAVLASYSCNKGDTSSKPWISMEGSGMQGKESEDLTHANIGRWMGGLGEGSLASGIRGK